MLKYSDINTACQTVKPSRHKPFLSDAEFVGIAPDLWTWPHSSAAVPKRTTARRTQTSGSSERDARDSSVMGREWGLL